MEKREYPRRKIEIPVHYKRLNEKRIKIGYLLPFSKKARTLDMSGSGILMSVNDEFHIEEKISVNLSFPETEVSIKGIAKVVRTRRQEKGFVIAIQFTDFKIEGDELLSNAIKETDIKKAKSRILQKWIEQEILEQR